MEQVSLEGDINQCGRVTPVPGRRIVQRDIQSVAEALLGIMAGSTVHGPVAGQAPVEEELLAKFNLSRSLWVLVRNRNILERFQTAGKPTYRKAENYEEK
jgi:hypothetical protein